MIRQTPDQPVTTIASWSWFAPARICTIDVTLVGSKTAMENFLQASRAPSRMSHTVTMPCTSPTATYAAEAKMAVMVRSVESVESVRSVGSDESTASLRPPANPSSATRFW